jgi:saccharopine dehydrogenase-like NADP-dependent oxidoreductase
LQIKHLKTILLFGAGKSATVLIQYLIAEGTANNWKVLIVDADKTLILSKTNSSPVTEAIEANITNEGQRNVLIKKADIVISMLPPALHGLIVQDCIKYKKNLLTASYVDGATLARKQEIESNGLLFLFEMGLDPGIDHMSAMKIIDEIHAKGGIITSFKSHCGGLVSPESDNNPWHYKISWNPRNVVMAGKAGAIYRLNGNNVKESYHELFEVERGLRFDDAIGFLSYYPNRDSLGYIETYGLQSANTFLRTTLRYPDFMYGWNNLVELDLTNEEKVYETDGLNLAAFFKLHFEKVKFGEWLEKKLSERLEFVKDLTEKLQQMTAAEEEREEAGKYNPEFESLKDFSIVDEEGALVKIDLEETKNRAAYAMAHKMHEANITLKQLFFLGLADEETRVNKGLCSAADVLQFALEKKLALLPTDKDMIVMLHELEYLLDNKPYKIHSALKVLGGDSINTAMAKTVGLPLGIAAKLILDGTIGCKGLLIPTLKEIYAPVLKELAKWEIFFTEKNN